MMKASVDRVCLGVFVWLMFSAFAARAPAQSSNALRRPRDLREYDACIGPQPPLRSQEWWRVWVDREGVTVYGEDALKTKKAQTLKFLEPLYVAQVNASKTAMLVIRSKSLPFSPTVVVDTVVGWVKTENLLMNVSVARSDKSVPKKVFIINDWKGIKQGGVDEAKARQVTVRTAPADTAPAVRTLSGSDIFSYVYKYDSCKNRNWSLVGTKVNITALTGPETVIIGWIPKSRVAEWSTREAFEPAIDRKIPANVFASRADLTTGKAPLFTDRLQREPWPADKWRYVLLSEMSNTATEANIGWLGNLAVTDETLARPPTNQSEKAIRQIHDVASNMNIIFVMDATFGMGPYLREVADAVDRTLGSLKVDGVKAQFGAILYKGFPDSKKAEVDIQSLSPDTHQVSSFLRRQKETAAGDRDFEVALFGGLEVALQKLAEKNKRNIVIVMGDAGNRDAKSQLSEAAWTKLMKDRNVFMYALHLKRPAATAAEQTAIDKFSPDMQRVFAIINKLRLPGMEKAKESWPKAGGPVPQFTATVLDEVTLGQENPEDIQRVANKISTEVQDEMKLAAGIVKFHATCEKDGFLKCGTVVSAGETGSATTAISEMYEIRAAPLDLLARQSTNPALVKDMIREKAQIFQPGWVKLKDSTGAALMTEVYLVSENELLDGIRTLQEFLQIGAQDGAGLVKVIKRLIETATGTVPPRPDEYVMMRSGLSFKSLSPFLSQPFDQIEKSSPDEILAFLNAVQAAADKLQKLRTNKGLWFTNYGQEFAWIPASEMP